MTELERQRNRLLAPLVMKNLEKRNMEAYFAETCQEAVEKALELIPQGATVGWGGVTTAHQMGLVEALRQGDYRLLDRDAVSDPAQKKALQKQTLSDCDYFLTSVNGMSEDGVLVNIDGNANRVAAISCGPDHVLMLVGMNKVVHTAEDAYRRAKYLAAPVNAQRFGLDTPCGQYGKCAECLLPQCICCQILVTRYSRVKGRIKVILINQELGF